MQIIHGESNGCYNEPIILEENGDLSLIIASAVNLDLYWILNNKNANVGTKSGSFTITKENYELYSLFEQLYYDIETGNVDNDGEDYLTNNRDKYNSLFNKETKTITWRSDEELANVLTIKKEEETFELIFTMLPMQYGLRNPRNITIRFRRSGSSYDPFDRIFARMYRNLKGVTNVDEENHQLHIEEYMYRKGREKK